MVSKMINKIMQSGKKGVAERIVYGAFRLLEEKKKEEPLSIFKKALENLKPQMEVRSRRVGGANYQVPVEVRSERKLALGLKWLIAAAGERGEKTLRERLAMEILEALDKKGGAMRKKEETHKMAEANRAFAHYKW
jgi:small subunit ribosomal protein S7